MHFRLRDIADLLQGEIVGNEDVVISGLGKIQEAGEGSIAFLANPKYENHIYGTKAAAVLVKKDFVPSKSITTNLIKVEDPYLAFTILLDEYYKIISFQKQGIEQPCHIGNNSICGKNGYRGAFSYIGENAKIGDNVKIYPHAFIGDNVIIGNNSIIRAGVKIYENTIIGNHCVIHSGVVIGSDGFGFAPAKDGTYKKIPQIGNVIIEDDVEIGSNTVIDRATMGTTVIHQGVKLDNLIQIAHNVEIGDNTVIAAQTGISGSTKIGKNCVIGGNVGMVGHIELGDRITVGARSGISKSWKDSGTILWGYTAFEREQSVKSYVIFKKLPDLLQRIRDLEKKVLNQQEE
jgi:UDP-3-O-[3-hydroxymyristoyl] glucosamine N-acyltransferase